MKKAEEATLRLSLVTLKTFCEVSVPLVDVGGDHIVGASIDPTVLTTLGHLSLDAEIEPLAFGLAYPLESPP